MDIKRLILARYWLMLVMSYYIFRCIFVIFPKLDKRTQFEQVMIII